jgi:phospholipid/cholesterol/gamma-HCH transport system substrate-binding protein
VTNPAKVGIFSTITIVVFILGFYFLKGINLFQRKNAYYAVYDRVDGLYKSNMVDVNGFPCGRVGNMERDPVTGKIVIELDLDKNIRIPKSDSTQALLISTDLLGSKKVRLVFGHSTEYLEEGDTINTFFKKDFAEQIGAQIDPIMLSVQKMVPTVDSLIHGINLLFDQNNPKSIFTTLAEVNDAIRRMDSILAQNQQSLKATFKNVESITENIEKNNGAISVIVKNAQSVSDSLQQANLKQTVENLNLAVMQLKALLAEVNEGKGSLGKIVKGEELYTKVDSTISSMNALVKDVKARPYRYISINVLGSKKAEKRREQKYNESGVK